MTFRGHRVGDLLTALKTLHPGQVPATWYVHDAVRGP